MVIGSGLSHLASHPELLSGWLAEVRRGPEAWRLDRVPFGLAGGGWATIILVCLLLFPSLALGLSGFETGVVVMPLVRGRPDDNPARPRGRIQNTRKLLLTAALIMSALLLGSALVTSTLIPPEDLLGPRVEQLLQLPGELGEPRRHRIRPQHASDLDRQVFLRQRVRGPCHRSLGHGASPHWISRGKTPGAVSRSTAAARRRGRADGKGPFGRLMPTDEIQ